MASSTAQRIAEVRVSGAHGELARGAKTWAVNVTLGTKANGKSFGSIHGNLFLSTKSSFQYRENGVGYSQRRIWRFLSGHQVTTLSTLKDLASYSESRYLSLCACKAQEQCAAGRRCSSTVHNRTRRRLQKTATKPTTFHTVDGKTRK